MDVTIILRQLMVLQIILPFRNLTSLKLAKHYLMTHVFYSRKIL